MTGQRGIQKTRGAFIEPVRGGGIQPMIGERMLDATTEKRIELIVRVDLASRTRNREDLARLAVECAGIEVLEKMIAEAVR